MTDFLDEKKREIKGRMEELSALIDELKSRIAGELEPLETEHAQLDAALRALDGVDGRGRSSSPRRGSGGSGSGGGDGSRGRGRPKGSGSRAKEALKLVKERPGITIPEIAEAMDIKQNYLYRVMPDLQKDGLVRKEGRGWHALDAA
jgi:hypothetical protein